ncbi:sir2-type regulatory transcription factor silent information regulator protein, partial [Thalassiosira pseudonana CCMP1335]
MSASYAERLSEYPNKGVCGLPESYDTPRSFTSKLDALTKLVKRSRHTVVLTGAGISTGAGIPDFRGPSGIWTKEQERKKREKRALSKKKIFTSFASAIPTYTHRTLTSSNNNKFLHHIVTQNIDGLHRKTHLPRQHQSILHGCIFTEICDTCHTEHVRSYEIDSIGLKYTGNVCTLGGSSGSGSCKGKLKDTLLDWEDALPDVDWTRAQEECEKADLIVCLGTSLRIEPAGSLCGGSGGGGGRSSKLGYAIVNLQQTPYDDGAALVIRAKVDDVMRGLMA